MNMKVENEMALPTTKSVAVMLLEPYAGKLARTVLRGESSRKGADLLDIYNRDVVKKRKELQSLNSLIYSFSNSSTDLMNNSACGNNSSTISLSQNIKSS